MSQIQTTRTPKIIVDDTYFVERNSPYLGKRVEELEKKYSIKVKKILGHSLGKDPEPDKIVEFLNTLIIEGDAVDVSRFLYEGRERFLTD